MSECKNKSAKEYNCPWIIIIIIIIIIIALIRQINFNDLLCTCVFRLSGVFNSTSLPAYLKINSTSRQGYCYETLILLLQYNIQITNTCWLCTTSFINILFYFSLAWTPAFINQFFRELKQILLKTINIGLDAYLIKIM